MAGIYIHIPFCKKKCHYCNFHLSASMKYKGAVVDAIIKEIALSSGFLKESRLTTIYFGGGTPSLLSEREFYAIFKAIEAEYDLSLLQEVTVECNPDDVSADFMKMMKDTPVNRFSLGVQSLDDTFLSWLNRSHNVRQSFQAIEKINKAAPSSWTLDLIYGIPGMDTATWHKTLEVVSDMEVPHLSAYALTVEPKTALHHFIQKKKNTLPSDVAIKNQFEMTMQWAENAGYEHYEISNYALPGHRAMHNTSYWMGHSYLGIGPSAHSFDGRSIRRWNIRNNPIYVRQIAKGYIPYTEESLSVRDRYNEYVMTRLRLKEGVKSADLEVLGADFFKHFTKAIRPHIEEGRVLLENGYWRLSMVGKHFADGIASDAFMIS